MLLPFSQLNPTVKVLVMQIIFVSSIYFYLEIHYSQKNYESKVASSFRVKPTRRLGVGTSIEKTTVSPLTYKSIRISHFKRSLQSPSFTSLVGLLRERKTCGKAMLETACSLSNG